MITNSYFTDHQQHNTYFYKERTYCYKKYFYRCKPPEKVPGPLPIAAVGGAFLWSRRMRRRIKAANKQTQL